MSTLLPETLKQCIDDVSRFCELHLYECCQEILTLKETGILPDGRVREMASMYREGLLVTDTIALDMAKAEVADASMRRVIHHVHTSD